jgi:aquaporin Z
MAEMGMKLLSEGIGTFFLMLVMLSTGGNAIMMGLTVALLMFLFGTISGGLVNPALALGMWISGSLGTQAYILYVFVQAVGAALAVYAYNAVA